MDDAADGQDIGRDVTWMSYAELGRLRGTSAATARRMANRKRWRKQPGNDGTIRVAVPAGVPVSRETAHETSRETSRDLLPQALAALETAVSTLSRELAAKDAALADAETRLRDAEQAARIATDALNAARRAEEARKGRGALRRAWDGWRGR